MTEDNSKPNTALPTEEKNLERDRLVFFCDAVVAIAITLLVIDLKVENIKGDHFTFKDLLQPWHRFIAFALSFFNIAVFWKNHHSFYTYIQKINEKFLGYNILWLFFIVLLPFTTSLISDYFFDTPAMFAYSLNIFLITLFQNHIWDYTSVFNPQLLKAGALDTLSDKRIRLYCNLDMVNSIIAVVVSFFSPVIAFILLLTKIPMFIFMGFYFRSWRQTAVQDGMETKTETTDNRA